MLLPLLCGGDDGPAGKLPAGPGDPGLKAVGGELGERAGRAYEELPLGQGDVDWDNYLKALKNIGYDGYLTIEREAGPDPFADIREAVGFLKTKLALI